MSNIGLIIEEREAHIGRFMVGRLLPFRKKRMVGPFIFIDHMGPASLGPEENLDIPPHPHIGLSTLTYLFEGEILHRDGIGSEQLITPGAVNWMTAGKGIAHSERTPDHLRGKEKTVHGLQIWVALPKDKEEIAPSFSHTEKQDLPSWKDGNVHYKLIAGKAFGKESPVPVYSQLYFIEIASQEKGQKFEIGSDLYGESGIYILEGGVVTEGNEFGPKQLLVADNCELCEFELLPHSRIYIFGGEPFPEERKIFWNFVASDQEKIEQAKEKWKNKEFDPVPGDDGYVPLPG